MPKRASSRGGRLAKANRSPLTPKATQGRLHIKESKKLKLVDAENPTSFYTYSFKNRKLTKVESFPELPIRRERRPRQEIKSRKVSDIPIILPSGRQKKRGTKKLSKSRKGKREHKTKVERECKKKIRKVKEIEVIEEPEKKKRPRLKFVGDKNINQEKIKKLYGTKREYSSRRVRNKYPRERFITGLPYHTVVNIEFEVLNYYDCLSSNDVPKLEKKYFAYTFRNVYNKEEVAKQIKDLTEHLEKMVNYRSKHGKLILDEHNNPIPTNLQFVKVTDVVRWNKIYRPKAQKEISVGEIKESSAKIKFNIPDYKPLPPSKRIYP